MRASNFSVESRRRSFYDEGYVRQVVSSTALPVRVSTKLKSRISVLTDYGVLLCPFFIFYYFLPVT